MPRKDDPSRLYDEREVVEAVKAAIKELYQVDHDLLIELKTNVLNMATSLKTVTDDQEKRLRKVERLINYGAGLLLLASWLLGRIKI